MPKKHRAPYPPEFKRRLVELVRAGRTPESLAPGLRADGAMHPQLVKQADLDAGKRTDGLTTDERDELTRLRRENRELREEK